MVVISAYFSGSETGMMTAEPLSPAPYGKQGNAAQARRKAAAQAGPPD
jgi:Mg2+/Co2+ transporter CorB